MMVEVQERAGRRPIDLPEGALVADLAIAVGVNLESAIFLIGGRPAPTDTVLREGDSVRVVSAVSGG